jgi:ABC-type amino acid transport substrate-binding protein
VYDYGRHQELLMKIVALILFIVFALPSLVKADETWIIPVPDQMRPPFTYTDAGGYKGIYIDLMREIAQRIGVNLKEKTYPIVRRRELFIRGEIVITCCVNPIWRSRAEEKEVQLFSEPLHFGREVFIFPAQKSFPIPSPEALKAKSIVGIKGYTYLNEEHFGKRLDVREPEQIVRIIAADRGDTGLLQYEVAQFHASQQKVKIEFGPVNHSSPMQIRLHKSKAAYLPKINKAIADMKKDGFIDRIFKKYEKIKFPNTEQ